jgi:hypothetical protein
MGSVSGTECWRKTSRDVPGAAAEIGKELSIIEKISAENLWNTENEH